MTHHKGLTTSKAQERLKEFGFNLLTIKKSHPWWKILFSQFTDILVIILLVAAFIPIMLGEDPTDSYVIGVIVLLNAGIGFFQEFRTERTIEALKKMIHPQIRVLRDGQEKLIETKYLVPGDVVILAEGDKIPADGRVLKGNSLRIEEAALTGESVPNEKKEKDHIFMGTSVVHGSGVFEVVRTGMNTKFGEIARLTTQTKPTKSPLQKELSHIGIFVTKLTLIICTVIFVFYYLREGADVSFSQKIIESLMFAVAVAIAAVPEGLPTTITIALALGATILARKKAVIKRLSSVETLGSVTTICSDKTGTLTQNEMTVREIYLADRSIFNVSGVGYDPHSGDIRFVGGDEFGGTKNSKILDNVLEICAYCNEAKLENFEGRYRVLGDPTEGALLTLAQKSKKKFEKKVEKIFPFDSDRKMMSVVCERQVLVKGAPDQILDQCTHWTDGENVHPLNATKREKIQSHYERMAGNALRVLAFARRDVKSGENLKNEKEAESHLVFQGLVGMIDPPRDEVRQAVRQCHTAGIRVIVITGDFGVTAEAIARELGIVKGSKVRVLTGTQTQQITDKELSKMLKDRSQSLIFARSLPAQKMRIVQLLQKQGEVVAMTGDGVNDAPALKSADIGVAMGIAGTEVSKEAATMILLDDSFASIVTAIREGRRIYENLKKFIWFIFSCNIGELVTIFMAILLDFPMILTAVLILAVDLGTDILPAVALGVDREQEDLMKRPPRDIKKRVMNKKFIQYFVFTGLIVGLSVSGAYFWVLMRDGWTWGNTDQDITHAQTTAFTALVFVQLVNTFSARSETISIFKQKIFSNYFLVLANISSVLMVLLMIYTPFFNRVLGTTSLYWADWGIIAGVSFIPLVFIEIWKYIVRQKNLKKALR